MTRHGVAALAALAATLMMGGCSMNDQREPTDPAETAAAAQRLRQRPTLEDSERQLQRVVEQIAAAATELVPELRWRWEREKTRLDCPPPYDRTDGRMLELALYVTPDQPIPDRLWPQFIERIRPIAATVGATAPNAVQDRAGRHDVRFVNPDDGTTIKVGSQVATVIGATVGCRLPRDRAG
ncbi:LppA family lipoprotein [Nocardia pseudobrasiliensis]|uniref:Putative LppA-like lipoprotein n=1 Tax=Nocardia pseudobrasiliensis TaxID=45979 RepID=A0A370IBB8_9NOCA|nr:LppA family lipoprotein [Nocardia pseudobrasiliensis]RDI68019.1 putative LppA-like lipoprotein [Nocardia pseudobrasiliensis]